MRINHGGISGGKDSTALLLWMRYESGYPLESLRFTFCDTGNESPETLAYVQFLSENVHPIETIRPELDFYELAMKKHRFPSTKARFCTTELKLKPTQKHTLALIEEYGDVLLHSGIRRAESPARAKQTEEYVTDPYFDCDVRRPLLGWSIGDVWAIHNRYNIRRNPLYDMGMSRVGCYPCVMCRKEEIGRIALRDPERIKFLERMEAEVAVASPRGEATFFPPSKTPARFTSKDWTREKDGKVFRLSTVADVARWGMESPDVWQEDLDLDEIDAQGRSCPSMLGVCE